MTLPPLFDLQLLKIGGTNLTLGGLAAALGVFVFALVLAWAVRAGFDRVRARFAPASGAAFYVAGQISRYIIIFIGLVAAGSSLGLNLTSLSLFAGALGVGIGLGAQDIVKDFIAGLVLLLDKSVEVGDFVELESGVAGEVAGVGPRATSIVTNDNVDVLVPNSMLLTGKLTNWTRNRATRRIHVPFSVAYGSDKEKVRIAALQAARAVPFTLPEDGNHRTQVWLTGFGESGLHFELVVWPSLDAVKRPGRMMAAYCWALDDALRDHGVEIPFPQRDVRVRAFFGHEREHGLDAWRGEMQRASRNDAALDIQNDGNSAT